MRRTIIAVAASSAANVSCCSGAATGVSPGCQFISHSSCGCSNRSCFVQAMPDKLRFRDPIARGIATASSAHGLGTTAFSAKEPEALPFCAFGYALNGIFGSILCSIPAVRQSLLAIVG